jgi:hypothetical protein
MKARILNAVADILSESALKYHVARFERRAKQLVDTLPEDTSERGVTNLQLEIYNDEAVKCAVGRAWTMAERLRQRARQCEARTELAGTYSVLRDTQSEYYGA